MASGDVKAAVAALQTQLRAVRYPALDEFCSQAAEAGCPAPLLPALGYLLLGFSKHVALLLAENGVQLHGKSDLRFVEGVLRFARDALSIKSPLTAAQFLSQGFAQRKLQLVHDIVRACREHHNVAARKERLATLKAANTEQRLYLPPQQPGNAAQAAAADKQPKAAHRKSSIPRPPPGPKVALFDHQQQQQQQQHEPARPEAGHGSGKEPSGPRCSDENMLAGAGTQRTSTLTATATPVAAVGMAGQDAATAASAATAARMQPQQQQQSLPHAASPIEQPRLLPPSLKEVEPQRQEANGSTEHRQGILSSFAWLNRHGPQPTQELCLQPPLSFLGAGGLAGRSSSLQPVAAAQPQPVQQQQAAQVLRPQRQGPLAAQDTRLPVPSQSVCPSKLCTVQPAAAECVQHSAQGVVGQQVQPCSFALGQLQLPAQAGHMQQTGMSTSRGSSNEQQTRRLIEELQLRLGMAEEAAAAARREAQQAKEHMQARVTVLEGRVRFLEAGYELQPPQQQMLLQSGLHPARQEQPVLALPWGRHSPTGAAKAAHISAVSQADHAAGMPVGAGQQLGHAKFIQHAAAVQSPMQQRQPPLPPAAAQQKQPPPAAVQPQKVHLKAVQPQGVQSQAPQQPVQRQLCTRTNPLFAAEPPPSLLWPPSGAASCAAAGCNWQLALAAPTPAAERAYSSTTELITGMQARFSEADELLRSLQRP